MKTCNRSLLILLWFNTIQVLESQDIKVRPEVTGYLGHDVKLPCDFIPGLKETNITQVQWAFKPPGGEEILIIFFNHMFGVSVHNSFLKDRVEFAEQSLIIRNVEKGDAGSYTCSIATFPSGSFEGTTNLVVQDLDEKINSTVTTESGINSSHSWQEKVVPLMLPRMIAVGVFVLIVLSMFTTTYFIIIRFRRETSVKDSVYTDVVGPVMSD